jgi:hypothetical protein
MKFKRLPDKACGLCPRSEAYRLAEQGLNLKPEKPDSLFVTKPDISIC